MLTLGMDTSSGICSVGIFQLQTEPYTPPSKYLVFEGGSGYSTTETMENGQAERISSLLLEFLENEEIKRSQIQKISVCCGPGSFTGTRIALSLAQGMALGLCCALVGVNRLHALAYGAWLKKQAEGFTGSFSGIWVGLEMNVHEIYQAFFPAACFLSPQKKDMFAICGAITKKSELSMILDESQVSSGEIILCGDLPLSSLPFPASEGIRKNDALWIAALGTLFLNPVQHPASVVYWRLPGARAE